MSETINMLPDVSGSAFGAPVAASAQGTQNAQNGDTTGVEFKELISRLLGGTPSLATGETSQVGAGQQPVVEEEAKAEVEKSAGEASGLLGFTGMAQNQLGAADVVLQSTPSSPEVQTVDIQTAGQNTSPAETSRIRTSITLDTTGISGVDASVQQSVQPSSENQAMVDMAPNQAEVTDSRASTANQVEVTDSRASTANQVEIPEAIKQAAASTAEVPALAQDQKIETKTDPMCEKATINPEYAVKAYDASDEKTETKIAKGTNADSTLTASAAGVENLPRIVVSNSGRVQESKPGEGTVIISGPNRRASVLLDDTIPVRRVSDGKNESALNNKQSEPFWMNVSRNAMDINRAYAPEVKGEFKVAHGPAEQVIGAKMINQIVRSAKVHLFDGGAGMTLRLDPPVLGTLQMNVTATEGNVTANFQTSTEAAKHILEANMSSLKQSLTDAGINVDSINVSVGGNPNQNWNFHGGAQQGQNRQRSQGNNRFMQGFASPEILNGMASVERTQSTGGLDYLA